MKDVIGKKLVKIRLQTEEEMENLDWDRPATVLVFENGFEVFASRDDEGNNKGTLFTSFEGNDGYLFAKE